MNSSSRGDILGRLVGLLVFLVGVALLVAVFIQAFHLFGLKPADALQLQFTNDPKKDPTLSLIASKFGWILLQIAFLFIMALAASLISQRGINLYFSAMHGHSGTPRSPIAPSVHSDAQGEAIERRV